MAEPRASAEEGPAENPGWSLSDAILALLVALLANVGWSYLAVTVYRDAYGRIPRGDGVFVGLSTIGGALITVVVVAWTLRRRRLNVVESLRLHWGGPFGWPVIALFALCLAVAEDVLALSIHYPVVPLALRPLLRSPAALAVFGIAACLFSPVSEEIVFRGFLYPVLAQRMGVALAVASTAIFFGLTHLSTYGLDLFPVLMAILSGYLLTVVRVATGSTATAIVMHVTLNLYATVEAAIWLATRRL